MVRVALVVSFLAAFFGYAECTLAQQSAPAALAITNVKVFTGERVIERAVINVVDGKIVSIGDDAAAPGAARIDGAGMTALPGLIDAHVHLLWAGEMDEAEVRAHVEGGLQQTLQAFLNRGVTTVLSLADPTDLVLRTRQELRDGTRAGPRLLCAGPAFTAPGGHPAVTFCRSKPWCRSQAAFETSSAEEARQHVRRLAQRGIDAIKIVNQGEKYLGKVPLVQIDPAVMRGIVEEAGAQRLPVVVHIWTEAEALQAIAAGANLAHPPAQPLASDTLPRALREADRFVITTLAARQRPGAPELENLRALHQAGVALVLGSDSGPTPPGLAGARSPGESTLRELEALIEVGLTPHQALATATSVSARRLGLEKQIGRLEPGLVADILLVRGDPLANIADLRQVEAVIQAGKIVHRPAR